MLLLIDNFDSFTYNLVQYFQVLGACVQTVRNHALTILECLELKPKYLVIGPGPGNPAQAGISKELVKAFSGKIPILGICLGHQAIAEVYGGKTIRAGRPMHGKTSTIQHNSQGVFCGIKQNFSATRYHSLLVEKESLPLCFDITAQSTEGEIMGIRHKNLPIEGVQFHPESILTEEGITLLQNFLNF